MGSVGAAALLFVAALPPGAQAEIVPHVSAPHTVTVAPVGQSSGQSPAPSDAATSPAPAASSGPANSSAPTSAASAPSAADAPALDSPQAASSAGSSHGFGVGQIEDFRLSGNPYQIAASTIRAIAEAKQFADAITNLSDTRPGPTLPSLPEPEPEGFSIHDVVCAVLTFVQLNDKISDPTNGAKCL